MTGEGTGDDCLNKWSDNMETKICGKCRRELEVRNFEKRKSSKDGLQSWCTRCRKPSEAHRSSRKKANAKKYVSGKCLPKFMFD